MNKYDFTVTSDPALEVQALVVSDEQRMSKRVRAVPTYYEPETDPTRRRKSKSNGRKNRNKTTTTTQVVDVDLAELSSTASKPKLMSRSRSRKVDEIDEATPWKERRLVNENAPSLKVEGDLLEIRDIAAAEYHTNERRSVFENISAANHQSRRVMQENNERLEMFQRSDNSDRLDIAGTRLHVADDGVGTNRFALMDFDLHSALRKTQSAYPQNEANHTCQSIRASTSTLVNLSPRIRGGCDNDVSFDDESDGGGFDYLTASVAGPSGKQINCKVAVKLTPNEANAQQSNTTQDPILVNIGNRSAIDVTDDSTEGKETGDHDLDELHSRRFPSEFNQSEKKTARASEVDEGRTPANAEGARDKNAPECDISANSAESSKLTGESGFLESMHQLRKQADESGTYVEEMHYSLGREEPLPQAPPLPHFPPEGSDAHWEFDQQSRVLYADFRGIKNIKRSDRQFIGEMLQRDDLTVISRGLFEDVNLDLWNPKYFSQAIGDRYYHKFRRFDRCASNSAIFEEKPSFVVMRINDFFRYLSIRSSLRERQNVATENRSFVFENKEGEEIVVDDVLNTVFYMIDVDMLTYAPDMFEDLKKNFKMPEILPGGSWCMLNAVPPASRPFMGPNMYLTPGGGFTQLHQDGHGTVDSGHLNLSGFNEVIMLRRLPEEHKKLACEMVDETKASPFGVRYDPLYGLPHADNVGMRPRWPTTTTVEKWRKMNYYPSVFILQPGEHVHINKGRLHAFRKLSCASLPEDDCHAALRDSLIKSKELKEDQFCCSVAYDWMFRGVEADAINREISYMLESAALCRMNKKRSLAIPESTLLHLAKSLSSGVSLNGCATTPIDFVGFQVKTTPKHYYNPSDLEICRGILPSLKYVVEVSQCSDDDASAIVAKGSLPDADENPLTFSIDPFGSDYYCLLCSRELSNVYFHCEGCEKHLSKDYNICSFCFREKAYTEKNQMNSVDDQKRSDIIHIGKPWRSNRSFCPCHRGVCRACGFCKSCSCVCHMQFSSHQRHFTHQQLQSILVKCQELGGAELPYSSSTIFRLKRCFVQREESRTVSGEVGVETTRTDGVKLNSQIASAGVNSKVREDKSAKKSGANKPRKATKPATKDSHGLVDAPSRRKSKATEVSNRKRQPKRSVGGRPKRRGGEISISSSTKFVPDALPPLTNGKHEARTGTSYVEELCGPNDINHVEAGTTRVGTRPQLTDQSLEHETKASAAITFSEVTSNFKLCNDEAELSTLFVDAISAVQTHERRQLGIRGTTAANEPDSLTTGRQKGGAAPIEATIQDPIQDIRPQSSRRNQRKAQQGMSGTEPCTVSTRDAVQHTITRKMKRKISPNSFENLNTNVHEDPDESRHGSRRPHKMPDRFC